MLKLLRGDFRELVVKPEPRELRFKDYKRYQACCEALNAAGRYHVADVVKEFGYARVCQVFAVTIVYGAGDLRYEPHTVALAMEVPKPLVSPRHYCNLHPALLSDEFYNLIKLHSEEV